VDSRLRAPAIPRFSWRTYEKRESSRKRRMRMGASSVDPSSTRIASQSVKVCACRLSSVVSMCGAELTAA